jgi:hypothetical protein
MDHPAEIAFIGLAGAAVLAWYFYQHGQEQAASSVTQPPPPPALPNPLDYNSRLPDTNSFNLPDVVNNYNLTGGTAPVLSFPIIEPMNKINNASGTPACGCSGSSATTINGIINAENNVIAALINAVNAAGETQLPGANVYINDVRFPPGAAPFRLPPAPIQRLWIDNGGYETDGSTLGTTQYRG